MYDPCPITVRNPVAQINFRKNIETVDINTIKSALEKALSCMKLCSKKRKKRLPCANLETFHYTSCDNFVKSIISIQNLVSKTLGTTGNELNKLLEGQVSISDFRIAANEMLAYIEVIDGTNLDESAEEIFLTHLRSLRISLNKTPRTFLQQP